MVLPLSVDGLVVVATLAMLEDKRAGKLPRLSARVALGVGVLATLAFNLASAEATVTARAVAAVPAVAFLLAVEVLSRTGKPRSVAAPVPVVPAQPAAPVVPTEPLTELQREPAPATSVAASSPKVKPSRAESRRQSREDTADRVRRAAADHPDAGPEELAVALGVSERTVRRYLPAQPVRPVITLVPAAPAEPEDEPDPARGGDRVPAGVAAT
jgi:hypothetical protein